MVYKKFCFKTFVLYLLFLAVGKIYSKEERKHLLSSVYGVYKFRSFNYIYEYETKSKSFSREMWACDPNGFTLEKEQNSFMEVPISYQGFISNERNLNSIRNCRQSCSDYTNTRQFVCDENSSCPGKYSLKKELLCLGRVHNCITMQDDATVCVAVS